MFCTPAYKALLKHASLAVGALIIGILFAPRLTPGANLKELIAKAKEEGALNATTTSGFDLKMNQQLGEAFKKRFGLNIKVTLTPIASPQNFPRAAALIRAGAPPTYDAIEGPALSIMGLQGMGGIEQIPDWKSILAEINPLVRSGKVRPERLTSDPLNGFAFAYLVRVKSLLYNPRLISKDQLPKTHADLTDPKYKGMWTHPPWTSHWDIGPLVFPELGVEKWLEIARKAGKNAGEVLADSTGVERDLLGKFARAPANVDYYFLFNSVDDNSRSGVDSSARELRQPNMGRERVGQKGPATYGGERRPLCRQHERRKDLGISQMDGDRRGQKVRPSYR
ncbi:MAG: extracellular solute-binding protein [Deltaproteobacteria bacterium]|nr:extracellular solute-binding protein [Deltaproteobacteria bacterium]